MESPNNGHIGDIAFVRCREMSASRRLFKYYYMCGKLIPFHKVCPLFGVSVLGDSPVHGKSKFSGTIIFSFRRA